MARHRAPPSKQPARAAGQKPRPTAKKHPSRSSVPRPPPPEMATLYFHPQRGAVISSDSVHPLALSYRGGDLSQWREVMKVRMARNSSGVLMPVGGQTLPKGFLWGNPARQNFGMGGPELVFGPLSKVCRECKAPFIFPADAQKHLLEEVGLFIDVTAVRCMPCARKKGAIESAKRAHAAALGFLVPQANATAYLTAARAALALLEAGGRTGIDRAIGHARKARKLGAKAAEKVEEKLLSLRTQGQGAGVR